ncbi:MAG: DUF1697 domain-containing protein [Bacteroidales bacterium]|nr:DUF1697 domain-containing protein [Bacteroidales bacterium]
METFIALLRGINVSGKNLIKMAELVQALSDSGVSNVRTYIQSGNVVFESGTDIPFIVEKLIQDKIRERFGLEVPVQVLKRSELVYVSNHNPFINDRALPVDKLHLTFLNAIPDPALVSKAGAGSFLPDEFIVSGNAVFVYCPDGYGRTKLTNTFFEKKLKVSATTRNWATVKKLCEM